MLMRRIWLWMIVISMMGTSLCGFTLDTVFEPGTAEELILMELEACSSEISVSNYYLTREDVSYVFQKVLDNEPQLFYVSRAFTYTYDREGHVLTLIPEYTFRDRGLKLARMEMIRKLEEIIGRSHADFSDGDKALFIHDYLVQNFIYSPEGEENYDAYSLLTQGHGVCQAFSSLFILISRCLNLESDMVTSLSMDHAWNHVKIDNEYYHIDVTRDLSGPQNKIYHDRFLLSDIALAALGYRDYNCYAHHECCSSEYESTTQIGLFVGLNSPWVYVSPQWLAITSEGVMVSVDLSSPGKDRVGMDIDLNQDGQFTLADVLHPSVQMDGREDSPIPDAIREKLMQQALS